MTRQLVFCYAVSMSILAKVKTFPFVAMEIDTSLLKANLVPRVRHNGLDKICWIYKNILGLRNEIRCAS